MFEVFRFFYRNILPNRIAHIINKTGIMPEPATCRHEAHYSIECILPVTHKTDTDPFFFLLWAEARTDTVIPLYIINDELFSTIVRRYMLFSCDRRKIFSNSYWNWRKVISQELLQKHSQNMRARRAKQKIQISGLCPSVSVYADIYPQTQLPWSNTQFSLLRASKENAEEHSDQFKFIGCTQANS